MAKPRAESKITSSPIHDDQWRIPNVLWERIEVMTPELLTKDYGEEAGRIWGKSRLRPRMEAIAAATAAWTFWT